MNVLLISGLYPKKDEKFGGIFVGERYKRLKSECKIDLYKIENKSSFFYKMLFKFMFKKSVEDGVPVKVNNISWNNINLKKSLLLIIVKRISEKMYYYLNLSYIEKQVNISSYELIHAHWVSSAGYLAMLLSKRYNIPYIITAHGSDIHTIPKKNKRTLRMTLEVLENAERVIFVSEYLRNEAIKLGYKNLNSTVIYNGIDVTKFKPISTFIKSDKIRSVTYAGRLELIKGADRIPQIFKRISDFDNKIEFQIIGSGSLAKDILYNVRDLKCNYYPYLSHQELAEIFNKSDVVIVPSRKESFCCIIIEAQACGCKVVATDTGGIAESLGQFGILVEEGNNFENRFAESVIKVLNKDYNLEDLLIRSQSFSWDCIVNKEYMLYKEVLKKFK